MSLPSFCSTAGQLPAAPLAGVLNPRQACGRARKGSPRRTGAGKLVRWVSLRCSSWRVAASRHSAPSGALPSRLVDSCRLRPAGGEGGGGPTWAGRQESNTAHVGDSYQCIKRSFLVTRVSSAVLQICAGLPQPLCSCSSPAQPRQVRKHVGQAAQACTRQAERRERGRQPGAPLHSQAAVTELKVCQLGWQCDQRRGIRHDLHGEVEGKPIGCCCSPDAASLEARSQKAFSSAYLPPRA